MVSMLRRQCRFPADLEMEVYAGIVGREAAVAFLRWCHDERLRPVSAQEILDNWPGVAERAAAQRDDLQGATVNDLVATLQRSTALATPQEEHLVAYIACLPRDLRFGLVKALLKIPYAAQALSQDKYDSVILDAIRAISEEA